MTTEIESILVENRVFPPPADLVKQANVSGMEGYQALCDEAKRDPDAFWARLANENLVWDTLNGYFACPLLMATSIGVLGYGFRAFRQKEVGKPTIPITLPGHWWVWTILFAIGMGLALALVTSLIGHLPQFVQ